MNGSDGWLWEGRVVRRSLIDVNHILSVTISDREWSVTRDRSVSLQEQPHTHTPTHRTAPHRQFELSLEMRSLASSLSVPSQQHT